MERLMFVAYWSHRNKYLSFLQPKAKRKIFHKTQWNLESCANLLPQIEENDFLSFSLQLHEIFMSLNRPRRWHTGRKAGFQRIVELFEVVTKALKQAWVCKHLQCGFIPVAFWKIPWGQSKRFGVEKISDQTTAIHMGAVRQHFWT